MVPLQWIRLADGAMLVVTSHSVVTFGIDEAGAGASSHIDGLLGGSVWRAIERRAYDWWLIDSEPPREVLLEADVKGRLYYGLDGRELFTRPAATLLD